MQGHWQVLFTISYHPPPGGSCPLDCNEQEQAPAIESVVPVLRH
jgi:hypothetical protein